MSSSVSKTLTDFSEIRLTDQSTGMILFRGRVYEHKSHYDNQYGSTLKVLAKDHLQELAEYPIDDAPPALRNIIIDPTSSVAYFNSYGKVINRIASQLSIEGFDFSDTTKFEASHAFTSEDLKTGSINDANKYYWDVATGKQFALQVIHDFSQQDPHDNPAEQHFGFDYYVDPNFTSTSTNHVPKPHFNYFKRNTRPGTNQIQSGMDSQSNIHFLEEPKLMTKKDLCIQMPNLILLRILYTLMQWYILKSLEKVMGI